MAHKGAPKLPITRTEPDLRTCSSADKHNRIHRLYQHWYTVAVFAVRDTLYCTRERYCWTWHLRTWIFLASWHVQSKYAAITSIRSAIDPSREIIGITKGSPALGHDLGEPNRRGTIQCPNREQHRWPRVCSNLTSKTQCIVHDLKMCSSMSISAPFAQYIRSKDLLIFYAHDIFRPTSRYYSIWDLDRHIFLFTLQKAGQQKAGILETFRALWSQLKTTPIRYRTIETPVYFIFPDNQQTSSTTTEFVYNNVSVQPCSDCPVW